MPKLTKENRKYLADYAQQLQEMGKEWGDRELTTEELRDAAGQIQEHAGVLLLDAQMWEILRHNKPLCLLIHEYGVEGDTDTRGQVLDVFAQHVMQHNWPVYGDGPKPTFQTDLRRAAQERGYQLIDETGACTNIP